jgi:hypothetical protein
MAISTKLANAAVLFFGYFVVALLLLHVIRPDYTIVDHMTATMRSDGRAGS